MKSKFDRWAPLIGGLLLAISAILKYLGNADLALVIDNLARVTGLSTVSIISPGEATMLVMAGAVIYGLWRKLRAIQAAKPARSAFQA